MRAVEVSWSVGACQMPDGCEADYPGTPQARLAESIWRLAQVEQSRRISESHWGISSEMRPETASIPQYLGRNANLITDKARICTQSACLARRPCMQVQYGMREARPPPFSGGMRWPLAAGRWPGCGDQTRGPRSMALCETRVRRQPRVQSAARRVVFESCSSCRGRACRARGARAASVYQR